MRNSVEPLSGHARIWGLILLAAVCIPHFVTVQLWLAVVVCALIGWGILDHFKPLPRVTKGLKLLIVILVASGIVLTGAKAGGLSGLVMLLMAAIALKVLEFRSYRDGWVLLLTSFFMIAVSLIMQQSMLAALYALFCLFIALVYMISMHENPKVRALSDVRARLALALMLQSLPLMIILFLIFPRIQPIWTMNFVGGGITGLSDTISPGGISQLTRSEEPAFRVSFENKFVPERASRYWRAMTYSDFDGVGWAQDKTIVPVSVFTGEPEIAYNVIAEPSTSQWLFALDAPVGSVSKGLQPYSDRTVQKSQGGTAERVSYRLQSAALTLDAELGDVERQKYLRLPDKGNPKAHQLVKTWLEEGLNTQQVIDRVLGLFAKEFRYTLTPQVLKGDQVDEFLFSSKQGFCEHFASSTAYILRLAGIPSRIVGGYQGGEWNEYEQYLLIRQYEAHAWVEAWLPGLGWQRIDPTAVVAPERLTMPVNLLFQNDINFMADSRFSLLRMELSLPILATLRQQYDALNYRWHKNILGYQNEQASLLKSWLGEISWLKLFAVVFTIPALLMGFVLWRLLQPLKPNLNQFDKDVQQLSRLLKKREVGLDRRPSETVAQYVARLCVVYPQLSDELQRWYHQFDYLRFTNKQQESAANIIQYQVAFRQLLQRIRKFKG